MGVLHKCLMRVLQLPNLWESLLFLLIFSTGYLIFIWVVLVILTTKGHLKIVKSRWQPFIWKGKQTNGGNGWRKCIARRRLKLLGKIFKRSCQSDLGQLRRRILTRLCLEYVKVGHLGLGSTNGSLRDLLIRSMVGLKRHWWEHSWVDWRMTLLQKFRFSNQKHF